MTEIIANTDERQETMDRAKRFADLERHEGGPLARAERLQSGNDLCPAREGQNTAAMGHCNHYSAFGTLLGSYHPADDCGPIYRLVATADDYRHQSRAVPNAGSGMPISW